MNKRQTFKIQLKLFSQKVSFITKCMFLSQSLNFVKDNSYHIGILKDKKKNKSETKIFWLRNNVTRVGINAMSVCKTLKKSCMIGRIMEVLGSFAYQKTLNACTAAKPRITCVQYCP